MTSIVGIRRIEVIFEGTADHAGTKPLLAPHKAIHPDRSNGFFDWRVNMLGV
ncbi:hypothetical protein [Rhodopseudomonas sp. B29]|uniref:hypothetical protein n=1 Tax=Rhodopseudomonas sp. B29 TaxID=95607 RepID=UPI00034A6A5F|nr:hypothetical protein [Rhodopseudomonas sp. B29]